MRYMIMRIKIIFMKVTNHVKNSFLNLGQKEVLIEEAEEKQQQVTRKLSQFLCNCRHLKRDNKVIKTLALS